MLSRLLSLSGLLLIVVLVVLLLGGSSWVWREVAPSGRELIWRSVTGFVAVAMVCFLAAARIGRQR
ncbi:hypothetical protein AADZ90_002075 [Aestuariibius sp. 2305UL40-4]|uniref:hypothetical protein n=1 Tax=Aestuariibius violaceus TaxID=3234132 RepID=UPI00345E8BB8